MTATWILRHKDTGTTVSIGDTVTSHGIPSTRSTVTGLEPPHKPGASGRVFTDRAPDGRYAFVYGLEYVAVERSPIAPASADAMPITVIVVEYQGSGEDPTVLVGTDAHALRRDLVRVLLQHRMQDLDSDDETAWHIDYPEPVDASTPADVDEWLDAYREATTVPWFTEHVRHMDPRSDRCRACGMPLKPTAPLPAWLLCTQCQSEGVNADQRARMPQVGELWTDPRGDEWLVGADVDGALTLSRPVAGTDMSGWRLASDAS